MSDFPFVLGVVILVVPGVLLSISRAGHNAIDSRHPRYVVDEIVQRGVLQTPADGRQEEALDLNAPGIESELRRVATLRPGQVIQNLVRVVKTILRQVDGQSEGRARSGGVEAAQSEVDNLDGRNRHRVRALRVAYGSKALVGDPNLVHQVA